MVVVVVIVVAVVAAFAVVVVVGGGVDAGVGVVVAVVAVLLLLLLMGPGWLAGWWVGCLGGFTCCGCWLLLVLLSMVYHLLVIKFKSDMLHRFRACVRLPGRIHTPPSAHVPVPKCNWSPLVCGSAILASGYLITDCVGESQQPTEACKAAFRWHDKLAAGY